MGMKATRHNGRAGKFGAYNIKHNDRNFDDILRTWETREPGGLPSFSEGLTLQTKERRALPMYVTYSDLIQIGIFICALVGLCYTIFKGKRK